MLLWYMVTWHIILPLLLWGCYLIFNLPFPYKSPLEFAFCWSNFSFQEGAVAKDVCFQFCPSMA